MYVCLPFPCMCCDCLSRLSTGTTYILLSWCCDIHSIWNSFTGFVTESYYSAREMTDMHFMYGSANGNSLYAEHYSQRRIPSHKLFTKLHQRLSESGSFAPRTSDHGRPPSVRSPNMKVRVLRRVEEYPGISCCSPSPWTVTLPIQHPGSASPHSSWPQCKPSLLLTTVQVLTPPDHSARVCSANGFSQNVL
jgi:hypothetical protein